MSDDAIDLGPCCMCGATEGVHNIIMLDRPCAIPGHGWGCSVCGLPPDGASAVLCNPCMARYAADPALLTNACRGYPASEGRIPIAELPAGPFQHDRSRHIPAPEDDDYYDIEDEDPGLDCGRWSNGRLTKSCGLAGSEQCDFECPFRDSLYA